jgi:hypothetical protein
MYHYSQPAPNNRNEPYLALFSLATATSDCYALSINRMHALIIMTKMDNGGYGVQPYQVGGRQSKSLAVIIPAAIVREYHLSPSTIFRLSYVKSSRRITLDLLEGHQDQDNAKATFNSEV